MVCDAKLGFDDNAFFRQSKNDHYSRKLILIENLKLSFLLVILVDIPCCPNYPPSHTFPSLTLSLCNFSFTDSVFQFRDRTQEDSREVEAAKYDLNYIGLTGMCICGTRQFEIFLICKLRNFTICMPSFLHVLDF